MLSPEAAGLLICPHDRYSIKICVLFVPLMASKLREFNVWPFPNLGQLVVTVRSCFIAQSTSLPTLGMPYYTPEFRLRLILQRTMFIGVNFMLARYYIECSKPRPKSQDLRSTRKSRTPNCNRCHASSNDGQNLCLNSFRPRPVPQVSEAR